MYVWYCLWHSRCIKEVQGNLPALYLFMSFQRNWSWFPPLKYRNIESQGNWWTITNVIEEKLICSLQHNILACNGFLLFTPLTWNFIHKWIFLENSGNIITKYNSYLVITKYLTSYYVLYMSSLNIYWNPMKKVQLSPLYRFENWGLSVLSFPASSSEDLLQVWKFLNSFCRDWSKKPSQFSSLYFLAYSLTGCDLIWL